MNKFFPCRDARICEALVSLEFECIMFALAFVEASVSPPISLSPSISLYLSLSLSLSITPPLAISTRMYLLFLISVPQPFVIHFTCQLFIFGTRFLILFAPRLPLGSSRVVYSDTCLISSWSWIDACTLRVLSGPARLEPSYVGIYICIFISILSPDLYSIPCLPFFSCFYLCIAFCIDLPNSFLNYFNLSLVSIVFLFNFMYIYIVYYCILIVFCNIGLRVFHGLMNINQSINLSLSLCLSQRQHRLLWTWIIRVPFFRVRIYIVQLEWDKDVSLMPFEHVHVPSNRWSSRQRNRLLGR